MMRALVLTAMALCVSAVWVPTAVQADKYASQWESLIGRKTGDKFAKTALLKSFAAGAKLCINGKCGGLEQATQFESTVDEIHIGYVSGLRIMGEGFMGSKWIAVARTGECKKNWSGSDIAYFNVNGQITEYHNWFDVDILADLKWLQANCLQDKALGSDL
eukprot:Rhum_TRINITY_DN19329_c0_g1::Rhum_TRINITY_DN19329_c0_g1_i1::g.169723::m.169723